MTDHCEECVSKYAGKTFYCPMCHTKIEVVGIECPGVLKDKSEDQEGGKK